MKYYKHWQLKDELPSGWSFSKAAGSPLTGYEFAMSGSPLRGGKTVLVRVREPQMQFPFIEQDIAEPDEEIPEDEQD